MKRPLIQVNLHEILRKRKFSSKSILILGLSVAITANSFSMAFALPNKTNTPSAPKLVSSSAIGQEQSTMVNV